MKKVIKIQFIIMIFLLACPVFAQVDAGEAAQSIQFGEYAVEYDASEEVSEGHTIYKRGGNIVLSVFDTDANGQDDLWLRYNEDLVADLQASDTTLDGQADTFMVLDADENVTDLKAPEFVLQPVELPQNPNPAEKKIEPAQAEAPDYFTLNPPPTKSTFSFSFKWLSLILLIVIVGYLIFRLKKNNNKKK